jgi:hypothetical protein
VTITYTVDPELLTFTELHNGVEVGSGDGADMEALRDSGDLDPALAQLWDSMIVAVVDDAA